MRFIFHIKGNALILREEGHFDQALEYFEKVYNLDRNRHIPLAEIGWIYCEKEDYDKAIQYITQAIDLAEEEVAEYHYRLGRIYWAIGGNEYNNNRKKIFVLLISIALYQVKTQSKHLSILCKLLNSILNLQVDLPTWAIIIGKFKTIIFVPKNVIKRPLCLIPLMQMLHFT